MTYSYLYDLNTIRIKFGIADLQTSFDKIVQANPSRAVSLLNNPSLSFPTLYLLIPQIHSHHLEERLSPRNQFALEFVIKKNLSPLKDPYLKWMLFSSINQELDTDEFQQVIDRVIIQLIVVQKEQSLLPMIVNLIFTRNRKNHCIYDLCWAVFQTNTVYTLPLIANYLKSNRSEDYELACRLLNFKPDRQPSNRKQQHDNFCQWFNENKPFLYFNNETMQETCQPKYWRVNLPAKYLCKANLNETALSVSERDQVGSFLHLDRKTQKVLSKYSYQTYRKDKRAWQDFMNSSINTQIETCKTH